MFAGRTADAVISGEINSANVARLLLVSLAIVSILPHALCRFRAPVDAISIFALYSIFCVLSTLWSVSAIPTFGKSLEMMIGVATVFLALNAQSRKRAERTLHELLTISITFMEVTVLALVIGYFIYPEYFSAPSGGVLPRRLGLDNVFISANGIAYYGATIGSYRLATLFYEEKHTAKAHCIGAIILSCLAILLSQGRGGFVALVIVGVLLMVRRYRVMSVPVFVLLVPLAYMLSNEVANFMVRGQSTELLYTLSGRTVIWDRTWRAILENPWLGYGFGVGARYVFLTDASMFDPRISSVHNAYLEVLVSVGVVGFLIYSAALIASMRLLLRAFVTGKNIATASVALPAIVTSPMTSGLTATWALFTGTFFLAIAGLALESRGSPKRLTITSSMALLNVDRAHSRPA